MGNWLVSMDEPPEDALAVLQDALEDEEPLVREHAGWRFASRGARPAEPYGRYCTRHRIGRARYGPGAGPGEAFDGW